MQHSAMTANYKEQPVRDVQGWVGYFVMLLVSSGKDLEGRTEGEKKSLNQDNGCLGQDQY